MSDMNGVPTSQIHVTALVVGVERVWKWGVFQWHDVDIEFNKNLSLYL
jgi:hypothetical protein